MPDTKTTVNAAAYLDAEVAEHMAVALRSARRHGGRSSPASYGVCRTLASGPQVAALRQRRCGAAAQHIATELVVRYNRESESRPMAAIALTTDTSVLTAIGNDFGFDDLFARQIEACAEPATSRLASRPRATART